MYRSNFLAMNTGLAVALALGGCTHLGTNVAGQFSCRAPKGDCQPLGVIDARAIHQLIKDSGTTPGELKQRISVTAADHQRSTERTRERTLRVVLPAHVDAAGTLHDEAVAWAVVEAPHWTGELKVPDSPAPRSAIEALRKAMKDAARRSSMAAKVEPQPDYIADLGLAGVNPKPLSSDDSAPVSISSPFVPAAPFALPSSAAAVGTGAPAPVAEGSAALAPPRAWTPRPWSETSLWPSAAAINAAVRAGRAMAEMSKPEANKPEPAKSSDSRDQTTKPKLASAPSAAGPK